MTIVSEQIRGILLNAKPDDIRRCGMSAAQFAQHCQTQQWYEISRQGQIIGAPSELDYFRKEGQPTGKDFSKTQKRELAGV